MNPVSECVSKTKRALLCGTFLFLSPALVMAAGFAKSSLFLSQSSVTEGESVVIYAPVQNSAADSFSGSVVFADGGHAVGAVSVSLKAGEARIVSVSWTPSSAGAHAVTATLQKADGGELDSLSETFSINAKPRPALGATPQSEPAAAIQSSTQVKDWLGNISPVVETALLPVFNTIDPLRQSASDFLDAQIAHAKPKLPGVILGAATGTPAGAAASVWSILWTMYFYLLTIFNFLIVSAAIFYPLAAVLFLLFLWKLYQRMSGRSYKY